MNEFEKIEYLKKFVPSGIAEYENFCLTIASLYGNALNEAVDFLIKSISDGNVILIFIVDIINDSEHLYIKLNNDSYLQFVK